MLRVAMTGAPTTDSMSGGRRRWLRPSLRKSRCDADGDGGMRLDQRDGVRNGARRAEVHRASVMSWLQHHGPGTRRQRSARPWRGRLCAGVTRDVCSVSVMAAAKANEWRCGAITKEIRRVSSTTGKVMPMPSESVRDRQRRVCRAICPLCVARCHCVWQKEAATCGKTVRLNTSKY